MTALCDCSRPILNARAHTASYTHVYTMQGAKCIGSKTISHVRPITLPTCPIHPPQQHAQHTFYPVRCRISPLLHQSRTHLEICFVGTPRRILPPLLPFKEVDIVDKIYSSPGSHLLQRTFDFLRSNTPPPDSCSAKRSRPNAYD